MPRTLPAELTTAMDLGSFIPYLTIGQRTWSGGIVTAYTTLISDGNIIYYKYDGLKLTVKWHSENLPSVDGLTMGERYYIERGVQVGGIPYAIKSGSLRFDDYEYREQICTAYFSLFSSDEKPPEIAADDTYENVITALSPNANATLTFQITTENPTHWDYQFYATGETLTLPGYDRLLPLLQKKYLIHVTDNSDDAIEDGIEFYHLPSPSGGTDWISYLTGTQALNTAWSPELSLFCEVGANLVKTSPDGFTWTSRTPAEANTWYGICWSPDLSLFCAVATTGTNRVMTSPDGITWTARSATSGTWVSVCWSSELALFCAVGYDATNRVMTSPDGITWTARSATSGTWLSVCWSSELTLFCAVAQNNPYVMTSPDGITWTDRTPASANLWTGVCWSSELTLFCAVAPSDVMTSPDGITWTARSATSGTWVSVCWSSELTLFCAVATTGTNRVMTSPDGITWTATNTLETELHGVVASSHPTTHILAVSYNGSNYVYQTWPDPPIDHSITNQTVKLRSTSRNRFLIWTNGTTTYSRGTSTDIVHDLGYLVGAPPLSVSTADRASVEIPIHLKYKAGDVIKLYIQADEIVVEVTTAENLLLEDGFAVLKEDGDNLLITEESTIETTIAQSAAYLADVVEIFDPNHAIGWRNVITLAERFGAGSARYNYDGSTFWPEN